MKEKIVKLINLNNSYEQSNLYLGCVGIVLSENGNFFEVLFINENIVGDYAIVIVNKNDVEEQFFELPQNFLNALNFKQKVSVDNFKNKHEFKIKNFNEGDVVKLVVDSEKYKKQNVFKGDIGVVAADYLIKNQVLVDFTKVSDNGETTGDCIAVNINDLEKID